MFPDAIAYRSTAGAVLLGLVLATISAGMISMYAHRYVAHGAVHQINPVVRLVMRTWIWMATGTNCRRWAALHINHHRITDRPGDPHSPQVASSAWRLGPAANWRAYRDHVNNSTVLEQYRPPRAAEPDQLDRVLFDRAWLGIALAVWVCWGLVGLRLGTVVFFTQAISYVSFTSLVNGLGHAWGYQRYTNAGSRYTGNSMALALLTGGENLHNNHHGEPTSPFLARRWWEFAADWPSLLLIGLDAVGLAELGPRRANPPRVARLQSRFWTELRARSGSSDVRHESASEARRRLKCEEHEMLKGHGHPERNDEPHPKAMPEGEEVR